MSAWNAGDQYGVSRYGCHVTLVPSLRTNLLYVILHLFVVFHTHNHFSGSSRFALRRLCCAPPPPHKHCATTAALRPPSCTAAQTRLASAWPVTSWCVHWARAAATMWRPKGPHTQPFSGSGPAGAAAGTARGATPRPAGTGPARPPAACGAPRLARWWGRWDARRLTLAASDSSPSRRAGALRQRGGPAPRPHLAL